MKKHRMCIALVFIVFTGTCVLSGAPVRLYYSSMRGADLVIAQQDRMERLEAIWYSLCRYREERGHFPASTTEWSIHEPNVDELLRAPRWSRLPAYVVHFNRLGSTMHEPVRSPRQLLVEDPGIRWPGNPRSFQETWRVGLTPDGQILPYTITTSIDRDPLPCPPTNDIE